MRLRVCVLRPVPFLLSTIPSCLGLVPVARSQLLTWLEVLSIVSIDGCMIHSVFTCKHYVYLLIFGRLVSSLATDIIGTIS